MDVADILELYLTPHGRVIPRPYGGKHTQLRGVTNRFSEHEAAGLVALAAMVTLDHVGVSALYWRSVAAAFLRNLCHIPETVAFSQDLVESPSASMLTEWILNAPPMQGAEYLSPDVLHGVWQRLLDWVCGQVKVCDGLGVFLQTYAPRWRQVGRVTLHLAENKGDVDYPFAFMATYAADLSRGGRLRRLPLGRALQEYVGSGRKPELLRLLTPLHEAAKRSALIADLVKTGDIFHPLVWTPAEAHAFLQEIPVYESCGLLAQLPDWWKKRLRPRVRVALESHKFATLGKEALLDFQISLALGDDALSDMEIKALLNSSEGLVLLRGQWVEVDAQKLHEALVHWQKIEQQVGVDGMSFIEGMRLLAGASADLAEGQEPAEHGDWSSVTAGHDLRTALTKLRSPSGLSSPAPADFCGDLRHYQLAGLNWLWLCSQLGLGACLADDMGLGKTIQVLAALLRNREQSPADSSLLVVPASLIGNWKAEATRFTPDLDLLIVHPSETPKTTLQALSESPLDGLKGTNLVVTTYNMVHRLGWLSAIDWAWVILDEAQAIKNPSTRQTRAIKRIKGRARVALTGTPVENRLGDLWSIFDFLNPGLLGTAARFKKFTKSLESHKQAHYAPLRNLVAPYILRRMKTDPQIAPDLPDKTEIPVYCGLAKPQAILYEQNVIALTKALNQDHAEGIKRRGLVLSYLMRFKQICNHPSQLIGDADYVPAASAKFTRLGELCGEIASRGEKALVFTQFREITEPLAEYLAVIFGRPGLVLHGGTAVKQRQHLVADFQREDGPPFFVLSIKAGGTGLNLTAASHVIHFDRWWNPAVENQATDRAFRIGQQRNVLVHKFVTRGTIEEKIDTLLREKQTMADALLEGGADRALTEMADDEILDMVALDIERAQV
ncbi:MAG TPA: DEAD/DEAH box helicase [Gammaproteobacteria bacterium]|nr:DEAD/DEAH box helicase [Gammaproteobacteria bacterium]